MTQSQNPKKSCLQIIGAKGSGGAEAFYVRFVKALSQHMDVHCVVREKSWVSKQLKKSDVTVYELPFGNLFDFKTKFKIKNLHRKLKPFFAQVWMSRAGQKLPRLPVPAVGRMGGYYNLKYYKNCDHLIGNTEDICTYIKQAGCPEEHVHYLSNFPVMPAEGWQGKRDDIRASLKLHKNEKIIFCAGRLHEVKAFDIAIKALPKLSENTHMILVGSGGLEDKLKALAEEQGVKSRVHFMGWQDDITPFVAASDVWLAPSRYEPLGNIVLEAWAHEKPLVAARSKGPESLIEHEKTGLLFDIDDVDSCASLLQRAFDNEKASAAMAKEGLDYLNNNFGEDVIMKKYLEFYENICAA
ncbi:MAG: glycosyltransferase [Alphaproteobacteria bacterium]|nr:glycosyltransferase [Alphaproteobacteria bacterium]